MKALIVDPALRSMGGHHHNAFLALQRELLDRKIAVRLLGSAFAARTVVERSNVVPTFTRSVYWRTDWSQAGFTDAVRQTYSELRRAQRWQFERPEVIILPCCDQVMALTLAKYLAHWSNRHLPSVLLWLLYAPNYKKAIDDPSIQPLFSEYQQAFEALQRIFKDQSKLTICCETTAMANVYGRLLDMDIVVEPGPNVISESCLVTDVNKARTDLTTVVCVGFANQPKGYRLLPLAIQRVLEVRKDVRFLVHGTVAGSDCEEEIEVFARLAKMGPQVVVRTDVLSQEEYVAWLKMGDVVLLPYDPEVYKTRGSGVFSEAEALGVPVVVTKGCGFAAQAVKDGWAQEIVKDTPEGVADALFVAFCRLPEMKGGAEAAANKVRAQKVLGATLRSILDSLMAERMLGELRPKPVEFSQ